MTDPVSIAGFGIGAVSLTFQLFSGCVKGYNLLSDANGMPSQLQYLRVRLKIEQHRLLNWAEVAKLSEQESTLCATLRPNEKLVQEILREKDLILTNFLRVQNSYQSIVVEDNDHMTPWKHEFQGRFPHKKRSLESKAVRYIDKARNYPTRLRWATFDKTKFESLLSQLSTLNDFMKGLLDLEQQRTLYNVQTQTSMQVLQLNNKIDHLLEIFQANNMPVSPIATDLSEKLDYLKSVAAPPPYINKTDPSDLKLATFARFKALNIAVNSDETVPGIDSTIGEPGYGFRTGPSLDPLAITILRSSSTPCSEDIELSEGLYNGDSMWIEWKYYDPILENGKPAPPVQQRISKLAALLSDPEKPDEFNTPRCLGYFNDWDRDHHNNRFGIAFQRPAGISSAYALTSLLELLSEEDKPSLTSRIRLASTLASAIHHLHSINWLHKALRSQNVVFFTEPGNVDLSAPYLCGFGLSRPAHNSEMTERPDSNPLYNLYRHPLAHGDAATEGIGGYKKMFDIYSLGIILMEIALWQPIHEVLGMHSMVDARVSLKPGVTRRIRSKLLNETRYLRMVGSSVGDVFEDVVKTCLEGSFDVSVEEEACQGAMLHEMFHDRVISRLTAIVV